jgi:type IV secretion system protein VirB3
MLGGVTYSFAVINAVLSLEFFLIFKSAWAILFAIVVHGIGWLACLREPRIFDLWITRLSRCPRVRNYKFWRCNSYRA